MTIAPRTLLPVLILSHMAMAGGLDDLATVDSGLSSHRSSSYDRTGGNTDNIESFAPKTSVVMLDTDGPGRVTHIWMTVTTFPNHPTCLRDLVLRMYWEGSQVPSVEVPLGDFFVQGHARPAVIESAPIAVGINDRALNCYWPMPFYKHARIELYNNGRRSIRRTYFHVDYERGPQPPNQGLFHAAFNYVRDLKTQVDGGNTTGKDNYVILDTEGEGQYVGCALFVDAPPGGWWGEGDDMIFIDHSETPVIIGTGSEDYFNNAWGYNKAFSYPYYGCPLLEKRPKGGTFTSVYRWHIPDPIRFKQHIRVTIEHIYSSKVANDYSSMAYWYQFKPIDKRTPLPYAEENHPKQHAIPAETVPAVLDLDGTELEPELQSRGLAARAITAGLGDGYKNGGWLKIENVTGPVELSIPVPQDGTYHVQLKPVSHVLERSMRASLKGGEMKIFEKLTGHEGKVPYLDLGSAASTGKRLTVVVEGNSTIGIDHLRIAKGTAAVTPSPDDATSSNPAAQ